MWCGFHTCSDIEIENTVIGFYEVANHNTENVFFLLVKSSSCKGADSEKREIDNKS
jgi:hypothetical protein